MMFRRDIEKVMQETKCRRLLLLYDDIHRQGMLRHKTNGMPKTPYGAGAFAGFTQHLFLRYGGNG